MSEIPYTSITYENDERRYYAALIMAGMQLDNPTAGLPPEVLAKEAVKMADALIAELDKEQE